MPGHRRRGSHGGGRAAGTAREGDHKEDEWGSSLQRKLGAADDETALLLLQQQSPGQLASVRPDAHGHTLVHTCAIAGLERCLDYLLGALALPVDSKDRDDKSPLHHAAYHNHPGCVDALLRYGADADAKAENRKFKSVMCRHHLQNACPFGDRCHFAYANACGAPHLTSSAAAVACYHPRVFHQRVCLLAAMARVSCAVDQTERSAELRHLSSRPSKAKSKQGKLRKLHCFQMRAVALLRYAKRCGKNLRSFPRYALPCSTIRSVRV